MSCFIIFFLFVLVLLRVMGSYRAWQPTALQHRTVGGYIKLCLWLFQEKDALGGGGAVTSYNGLYGEAPPERDTLSGFRYMKE